MPIIRAVIGVASLVFGIARKVGKLPYVFRSAIVIGGALLAGRALRRRGTGPPRTGIIRAPSLRPWHGIGRARVPGFLVFYGEKERDTHLALVLSEGACDSIEQIWVDGEQATFDRTERPGAGQSGHRLAATGKYAGKLEVFEYFDADGQQGDTLRAAFPSRWDATHQGHGISWVHVKYTQPNYGDDQNKRFWVKQPEFSFIGKWRKFTWPGQTTPTWTENVAPIRMFVDEHFAGKPKNTVDAGAFSSAFALCAEDVTATLPPSLSEYDATAPRYTANGVIHEDDDYDRIADQLDLCWAGHVVEVAGTHYYKPGADRTVSMDIEPENIASVGPAKPAPALQDRINAALFTLDQSKYHDYTEFTLPEQIDRAATARDSDTLAEPSDDTNTLSITAGGAISFANGDPDLTGLAGGANLILVTDPDFFAVSVSAGALVLATGQSAPSAAITGETEWKLARKVNLSRDLGTLQLVNDPITAARLVAIELRRARYSAVFPYLLQPGDRFEWLSILPTDIVRVTDPQNGLNDFRTMVARTSHNEDWSVELDLVESPTGIYDDEVILPPLLPRDISFENFRDVQVPDALTADISSVIAPDGTMGIWATITWEAVPVKSTHIQWRAQGGQWADFTTEGLRISIPWLIDGTTYEYRGRHVNALDLASNWTDVAEVDATGDRTAPADPANLDAFGVAGGYVIQWTLPTEADYQRTEILESEPTQSFLEADHERYMTGDGGFVPKASTDEVKIWVRHSDRTNNRSAVVSALATPLASTATGITITGTATASDGAVTVTFSDGTNVVIPAAAAGRGIDTISKSGETVTVTFDDNSPNQTFTVQDGRGIESISKSGDTVTINYTDNTTDTFEVLDGMPGMPGMPVTVDSVNTLSNGNIQVNFSDGTTVTIPSAAAGRGIETISKSGETVTVTFDDNSPDQTFTVQDGADGAPGRTGTAGAAKRTSYAFLQSRQSNGINVNSIGEWSFNVANAAEAWPQNLGSTWGIWVYDLLDDFDALSRIQVGSQITLYGSVNNWADYRVGQVQVNESDNRIGLHNLTYIESVGPGGFDRTIGPNLNPINLHFNPLGKDGADATAFGNLVRGTLQVGGWYPTPSNATINVVGEVTGSNPPPSRVVLHASLSFATTTLFLENPEIEGDFGGKRFRVSGYISVGGPDNTNVQYTDIGVRGTDENGGNIDYAYYRLTHDNQNNAYRYINRQLTSTLDADIRKIRPMVRFVRTTTGGVVSGTWGPLLITIEP